MAANKSKTPVSTKLSERTSDGDLVIGRVRPKNNPLIHRSEVGKPSFHNDLPTLPNDYTFGAPLKRDTEGAGDVMLTWQSHAPPESKMTYDFGRDFKTLNRQSVNHRCVTSKDVADFRRDHDARIKPNVAATRPLIAPPSILTNPHWSFGARSGESESVADLIQNRWEFEWVAEQTKRMDRLEDVRFKESTRRASPASPAPIVKKAAKQAPPPHPKHSFTLERFRNIPSRFQTPSPALAMAAAAHAPQAADYE
jgi:hypothetical protein